MAVERIPQTGISVLEYQETRSNGSPLNATERSLCYDSADCKRVITLGTTSGWQWAQPTSRPVMVEGRQAQRTLSKMVVFNFKADCALQAEACCFSLPDTGRYQMGRTSRKKI